MRENYVSTMVTYGNKPVRILYKDQLNSIRHLSVKKL